MKLVNTQDYSEGHTYTLQDIPRGVFHLTHDSPNYMRAMVYDAKSNTCLATIGQQTIPKYMSKLITNQEDRVHQRFPHDSVQELAKHLTGKEPLLVRIDYAFTFHDNSVAPMIVSTPNFYVKSS